MRALSMGLGAILVWAAVALGQRVASARDGSSRPPTPTPAGTGASSSASTRTESRAVAGIQRVELRSFGSLEVRQGPTESLSITAEDSVLPEIVSQVSGGTLELGQRSGAGTRRSTQDVRFALTVKNLTGLSLSGAGRADVIDVRTDALAIELSGSGNITLTRLDAQSLSVVLKGQGSVTASGKTSRQQVLLSGAGSYNARDLASSEASVALNGTGTMVINVARALDATLNGVGDIAYHGSPTVKSKVNGIGRIHPG